MIDTSHDDLLGRVAMLELLMIQQAGIAGATAQDKDKYFAALRESAASRIKRLPEASRPAAERTLELIISSASQTARDLADFRNTPNATGDAKA